MKQVIRSFKYISVTYLSCIDTCNPLRKFPPKTRQSEGV
ncbi:unnamed protein product [Schistosoma curassoni]|uniref:Uncharacterized protein n=1 Tax=Schistosoma curassoni TaxID=6186 RepID=A0A183JH45_9TREM|nr:unnamed protein product [Schistosoma curassoni]